MVCVCVDVKKEERRGEKKTRDRSSRERVGLKLAGTVEGTDFRGGPGGLAIYKPAYFQRKRNKYTHT